MSGPTTWSKAQDDKENPDRTDYYAGRKGESSHSHTVINHDPDTGRNEMTFDRDDRGREFTSDRRGEYVDIPKAIDD